MNTIEKVDRIIQRFTNDCIAANKSMLSDEFCSIDFSYFGNNYSIVLDQETHKNFIFHNGISSYVPEKHYDRKEFTLTELLTVDLNYFLNYVYENYTN